MTQIQKTKFDYQGFPRDFAKASQARAEQILNLDREAGRSIIEMGRILKEQREAFGSVNERSQKRGADTWSAWLQQELGWQTGRDTANRYIQIFNVFGAVGDTTTAILGYEKMKLLSTKSTPPELRDKVIKMAQKGDVPTHKEIEKMKRDAVAETSLPPVEAKKKAQEIGKPVVGSDQRIYTPLSDEESAAYNHRRDQTYELVDSVNFVSQLTVKPATFLKQAEPHWLKDLSLGDIEAAVKWLTELQKAFAKHEGIIDGN